MSFIPLGKMMRFIPIIMWLGNIPLEFSKMVDTCLQYAQYYWDMWKVHHPLKWDFSKIVPVDCLL
jgi:hypothetical protein